MKKRITKPSRAALRGRLPAYSAAAGAALLGAQQASAEITLLTGANMFLNGISITENSTFTFANTPHFASGAPVLAKDFSFTVGGTFTANSSSLAVRAKNSNAASGFALGTRGASRFGISASIRPELAFGFVAPIAGREGTEKRARNFDSPHSVGYLGFRFVNGSQRYYGWLKVGVAFDSGGRLASMSFLSVQDGGTSVYGAYGLASDDVRAGFTKPGEVIPELSTAALAGLGLLALGAAGVREMRRRRREAVL